MRHYNVITKEELARKILESFRDTDEYGFDTWLEDYGQDPDNPTKKPIELILNPEGYVIPWRDLSPKIPNDMDEVCEFDFENVDCKGGFGDRKEICGFRTLENGLSYAGVVAGGDWEAPIFFIIYWDGENLRAYIPTEGNPFNRKEKSAFGNCDNDEDEFKKQYPNFDTTGDFEASYATQHVVDNKAVIKQIESEFTIDSVEEYDTIDEIEIKYCPHCGREI